jgi:hypothetical protein
MWIGRRVDDDKERKKERKMRVNSCKNYQKYIGCFGIFTVALMRIYCGLY